MYQLPPSIDNFTGVFALILLAQSISIARDYCNETLRTTDEPAGFLIRNQCEVAIKSALRPALLVYFGIALLSFDSRLLTAGAIWTWLVDGAMKLSHAIGVAAGMVVFAYQLGTNWANPWPHVLKATRRLPSATAIAFFTAGIQIPEDVDYFSRLLRPAVTLALVWYALSPVLRSLRSEFRKFTASLSQLRVLRKPTPTPTHAPRKREEPLPCPARATGPGKWRRRFSPFALPLAPRSGSRRSGPR